jgi:hypothetical protein
VVVEHVHEVGPQHLQDGDQRRILVRESARHRDCRSVI